MRLKTKGLNASVFLRCFCLSEKRPVGEAPQTRHFESRRRQLRYVTSGKLGPKCAPLRLLWLLPTKQALRGAPLPEVIAACRPCLQEDGNGSREYITLELQRNRAAIGPVFLSVEQQFSAVPTSVQSGQATPFLLRSACCSGASSAYKTGISTVPTGSP